MKPVSIKVFLVPTCGTLVLPKGKKRQELIEEKRVEVIQIKRTMSPAQVHQSIVCGFRHLKLHCWEYLDVDGGHLKLSANQSPGGEIVDRRGGLYIREKEKEVSTSYAIYEPLFRILLHVSICLVKPNLFGKMYQ